MEFFASYPFSFPSQNVCQKRFGLTFRLGGRWRRLSAAQFATRMGLYTEGDLALEVFDGVHDFEDEIEKATFWSEVAKAVYDPQRAKYTKLHDPLHRFIHRVLIVGQTPVGMFLRGRDSRIWDLVPEDQEDKDGEHEDYLNFDPVKGADPPSNLDLWHRFAGLQVSQEELRAE
ncbi:hypothetical protein R6Q57_003548 [Mikania cordata]